MKKQKTKQHVFIVFNYTQSKILKVFATLAGALIYRKRNFPHHSSTLPDDSEDYIAVLEKSIEGMEEVVHDLFIARRAKHYYV